MYARYIKRPIDLILSIAMLTLSAPVMATIALLIRLESNGPSLFRQVRTGKGGEAFTLFKFRSMTAHNNVYDTGSHDEITRMGKFLRRTSLDELPQLINVIRGDMSFVGPRPWIPDYHKHMSKAQRARTNVRPGITGLAQARGRNGISIHEKIKLDLRYVNHLSLYEDLKVFYWTFAALKEESSVNIGKHGIRDELQILQEQQSGSGTPAYD